MEDGRSVSEVVFIDIDLMLLEWGRCLSSHGGALYVYIGQKFRLRKQKYGRADVEICTYYYLAFHTYTHTHIHIYLLPSHLHSTFIYSYHDSFSSTHLSRRGHSAYIYLLFSFLGVVNGTTIEGFIPFRLHAHVVLSRFAFVHVYREKKGCNPCSDPSWSQAGAVSGVNIWATC